MTLLGRGRERAPDASAEGAEEQQRYRTLEREWQNDVGYALLDKPYEAPGSEAVFIRQWDRLIESLDWGKPGPLVEIGCGKGHFLCRVRQVSRLSRPLVGVDISRAVFSLPAQGIAGAQADGELLPFRSGSVQSVVYDGSLHHLIDYPSGLREAIRILAPEGLLVIFEPMTSRFSQFVHRLLDPIIFRKVVYESPIDIRYKKNFHLDTIVEVLRQSGMNPEVRRSDFLAYPFTGCYASSRFARSERLMRMLMAAEDRIAAIPGLRAIAETFAWRFTILATKPATKKIQGPS